MPDETLHPNWQPISQLPLLDSMVQGILENTEDQYQTFLDVKDKPHVLDDAIVQRAQRLYNAQLEDVDLYETQAQHWLQEELMPPQRNMLDTMREQLTRIRDLSQKILVLLSDIEKGTINRIMAMSDEEVGLYHLRCTQKKRKKSKKKKSNMQKRGKTSSTHTQHKMTPSNKHQQTAQKIHKWVTEIHSRGGGMEEMLTNMIDYMPAFKKIMDSATNDQIDTLCEQYPGFYQFAALLEDVARGIQSGAFEVPDVEIPDDK